ncbi:MAG TPA: ATP-grasp domain-containing protein [Woeseiaceae bacterium]|nr:ATP-grasp domain-containing protein [Woeseiaceae bacterium]
MNGTKIRVGLTYDLRDTWLAEGYSDIETAEFDRADTIDSLVSALQRLGFAPVRIGNLRELAARLVAGDRWDIVFNICEGMHGLGREAQVPALLDAYEIPYVFSDPLVCALTLHKGMTKDVVRAAGVPTPDFHVVNEITDIQNVNLEYPLFAKPIAEGTGKGVSRLSKIDNAAQLERICRKLLREYKQAVLVERFLPGREFTVGVIGTGRRAKALATTEIVLLQGADADVYSYRNKEFCEELVQYKLLQQGALREQIEAVVVKAWKALGCRDGGRVDVRLDEQGQVHFLEVNPLAGIHPEHSDLPIMATQIGVSYKELIRRIMRSALSRYPALLKTRSKVPATRIADTQAA